MYSPNIVHLPVRRRMHIVRPLTLPQTIAGIVADLEALPSRHPDPADVRAIADRLHTLANRLEEGPSHG